MYFERAVEMRCDQGIPVPVEAPEEPLVVGDSDCGKLLAEQKVAANNDKYLLNIEIWRI